MNGEELRRRYATGERDFSGLDLRGMDISGIAPDGDLLSCGEPDDSLFTNLSGANLTRACLFFCILTNTNLSNANLTRACLDCAEFNRTDLRGANLLYAEICETSFKADARGARNVKTVQFIGTRVRGLVLEDGTIIDSDHDW